MLSALFSKAGLPVLLSIVTTVLGAMENSQAKEAASVLSKVDEALKSGAITSEQVAEANRHAEETARMELANYEHVLAEVNESFRTEVASPDAYVRRMRPTFGYMMALTWGAQMMAIAYVIVFNTPQAGVVIGAMNSLSMIWTVGLAVLGIYVYKRSDEKRITGQPEMVFWNKKP